MSGTLINKTYDITDEIVQGNVEKVAGIVEEMDDTIRNTYIPTLEEQSSRDDKDFAVVIFDSRHGFMNKYATYSKNLTALNLKLLEKNSSEIPDEVVKVAATNLKKAAKHYKLDFPESLEELVVEDLTSNMVDLETIDKTAFYVKTSKPEEIKEEIYILEEEKKFPIHNEELIKKAHSYYQDYGREMELPLRVKFAEKLLEHLPKYNIDPSNIMHKLANLNITEYSSDISDHLKIRKSYTHDEELKAVYDELIEKYASMEPKQVVKVMYEIDKKAGIDNFYSQGKIEEPVLVALQGKDKEEEIKVNNTLMTKSAYTNMVNNDLSNWVDDETMQAVRGPEGVEIFNSLPSPIKRGIMDEILPKDGSQ